MSFIPRRVAKNNLLTFLLLLLVALPVIGQESVLEQLIPDAPLFSIVSPLEKDVVSGDVIFILKPLSPLVKSSIKLVSSPANFESSFSENESFMVAWSSASVSDGSYVFEIEACDDARCESRKLEVVVKNSLVVEQTSTADVSDSSSDVVSDNLPVTDSSPSPDSSDNSSSDNSPSTISVAPSNFFGVFSIQRPSFHSRSSGGDFVLLPETYSADARFLDDGLTLLASNVLIDSPNVLFFLEKNVIDSFTISTQTYDVISSLSVSIPYSFDFATAAFAGRSSHTNAACLDWSRDSQSCRVDWIISPSFDLATDFSSPSVVFAHVSLRVPPAEPVSDTPILDVNVPDSNVPSPPSVDPPIVVPPSVDPPVIPPVVDPPIVVPPSVDPPVDPPVVDPPIIEPPILAPPVLEPPVVIGPIPVPVPLFSILPSNLPSTFSAHLSAQDSLFQSYGDFAELPAGEYDFQLTFFSGDLTDVSLASVPVDQNATLLSVSPLSSSISLPPNDSNLQFVHASLLQPAFSFSSFTFSLFNPMNDRIFVCPAWDVSSISCQSSWDAIDSSLSHSLSSFSPAVAIVYARPPLPSVSDANAVAVDALPVPLPLPADDARLINAIWALKNTHTNKRFFLAENAREQYAPLSALFSSVEVALQCDPSRSPWNNAVDVSSVVPLPSLPPVAESPLPIPLDENILPAPSSDVLPSVDANTTLSIYPLPSRAFFQGDENGLLPLADESSVIPPSVETPVDVSSPLPDPAPPILVPDFSVPFPPSSNPFFDPHSLLFFSNEWEDTLSSLASARDLEDFIFCDGVSLSNSFEDQSPPPDTEKSIYLGRTLGKVKQSIYVTNTTSLPQDRVVIIRNTSPFSLVSSDHGPIRPSSKYALIPSRLDSSTYLDSSDENFSPVSFSYPVNSILFLQNDTGTLSGSYDFSDFVSSGFSPDVLVHSRNNETVIETVLHVRVLPGETIFLDPLYNLGDPANFSSMFYGGVIRDYTARAGAVTTFLRDQRTPGVQFHDLDGNGYANDLIITSLFADVNTKSDAGAVYLVFDVDTKTGTRDLNQSQYYDVRWNGMAASVQLGNPNTAGKGVRVVNLDNNAIANDLVFVSPLSDGSAADAGIIYMILDAYQYRGAKDLNDLRNFTAMWVGATASDRLGDTTSSGDAIQILDIDGNGVPNDLVAQAGLYNGSGRTDNGAVFIIKDMNRYRGVQLLSATTSYGASFHGSMATDTLGTLVGASQGVFVENVDGNSYANDLIIGASLGDAGKTSNNVGEVYLIRDADKRTGIVDLNTTANYDVRWYSHRLTDGLGGFNANTTAAGRSIFVVNSDGNYSANDMIISCPFCDAGGTNRGAVYYIKDINTRSGDLNLTGSFNVRWVGATNTDEIGLTNGSGDGIIVADMDGNGVANDMIVVSYLHNSIAPATARTDNGAVYFIRDINQLSSGAYTLNNTTTSFAASFFGSVASDFLGDTNFSGTSVQLVNLDGNLVANDLLIGGHRANTVTVDSGAVYLIKDLNTKAGNYDFNTASNFSARWGGGALTDGLGKTNKSGPGIQLVNVDGNAYSNDLLLTAVMADVNAKTNAGAVYLIKDIYSKSGIYGLATSTSYDVAWYGGMAQDMLGDNNRSAASVIVANLDNNSYSNDVLISASRADQNQADMGALYLFLDVDKMASGAYDLNNTNNYYRAYYGATLNDQLSSSQDSNISFNAVDVDNNGYSNDVWVTGAVADINGRTEVGAVYLLRDVVVAYSVATVPPDINVWKIDSYPDNGDFPVFNYFVDGNLTLDFNVFDSDTNSLLLDINYSSSATPYTGTLIVDDVNLSKLSSSGAWHCDDTAFTNVTPCSLDWNIFSVADGNYFIHMTLTDSGGNVDQNTSDRSVGILNYSITPPSVSVLTPNTPILIGVNDGNTSIDFNVSSDTNYLIADIYYSSVSGSFENVIFSDLNLYYHLLNPTPDINCSNFGGVGFYSTQTCHYDWNVFNLPTQKVYVDVNVSKPHDINSFDSSNTKFKLNNWLTGHSNTRLFGVFDNAQHLVRLSDGNLWLAFEDVIDTNFQYFVTYSDTNGLTWQTPLTIPTFPSSDFNKSIAIDVNGGDGLHIIYTDTNAPNFPERQVDVHYRSCSPRAGSCLSLSNWSDDLNISADLNTSGPIDLHVSSDNVVHVVWGSADASNASVITYRACSTSPCSTIGNWSVTLSLPVDNAASRWYNPMIDSDSSGRLAVSALQFTGSTTYHNYFECPGACSDLLNWIIYFVPGISDRDTINTLIFNTANTLVKVKQNQVVNQDINVAYCSSSPCSSASMWTSSSITPVSTVSVNTSSLAKDLDGNIHILYKVNGTTNPDLNYVRLTSGLALTTPTTLDSNADSANLNTRRDTNFTDGRQRLDYAYLLRPNGTSGDFNIVVTSTLLSTYAPPVTSLDVNIIKFDGFSDNAPFKVFDYYIDGNITIDFNVMDTDTNSILVDINYSSSASPYTGTAIVNDVNLSKLGPSGAWYCSDTAFTNVTTCGIDWNIASVADGNYFIHITATNSNAVVDQNTSDRNVGVLNRGPLDVNGYVTVYSDLVSTDVNISGDLDPNETDILTIPAGRFIPDHNYLIFVSATLTGSTNAMRLASLLYHGSTPFYHSQEDQELPLASNSTWTYSTFVNWKAVAGENIVYRVGCITAATICIARNASIVAIDLNDLVKNVDWYYAEDTTLKSAMSDTFASNVGAFVTFTPDGTSDYWIMGASQNLINNTGDAFIEMQLWDGAAEQALVQRDAEDTADSSVLSLFDVLNDASPTTYTYSLRFAGSNLHDHNASRIFVLRLDALANHDSNIVDENYLISNVLSNRADVNLSLGKDSNVVAFYGAAVRHERGLVGQSAYDFQNYYDDTNVFSADGNFLRSWSTSADAEQGDLQFNFSGANLIVPNTSYHSYSTRLISETTDPLVDAHAERKAGVVVFSHRLSGDLNLLWDYPQTDGTSYNVSQVFSVSGRTSCEDYNCGLVGTKLQYCVGTNCTNFYDINSTAGSPLELVTGSIPDNNSDLNWSQSYDANWTIKGNTAGTYELRLYASGSTSEINYTPSGQRTVTISSSDYTFVLSLPSSGCTNGKGNITGGTSCQRAWIETSDTTGASDENQVSPEGQSAPIPFFRYDNQSSTTSDLNIVLDINEALSSQLRLKASLTSFGYQGGCLGDSSSGCILLSTSAQNVGKATYSTGTQDLNVWFWGDFVAASIQQTDVNVDSNSVSST